MVDPETGQLARRTLVCKNPNCAAAQSSEGPAAKRGAVPQGRLAAFAPAGAISGGTARRSWG